MRRDFLNLLLFLRRVGIFVACLTVLVGIALLPYVLKLRNMGEFVNSRTVAELSRGEPIYWLSAFSDSGSLKTEIARRLRPRLAVFGSSRVMQLRSEMFHRLPAENFYNLGGDFTSMESSPRNLEKLLAGKARPDLILLGIDWWWFERRDDERPLWATGQWSRKAAAWASNLQETTESALDSVQLVQNAWQDERFWTALSGIDSYDPSTGKRQWGLGARVGCGFRNDGSYRYPTSYRAWTETERLAGSQLRQDFQRFDGAGYSGDVVSELALRYLEDFLLRCRDAKIAVVVFLPPVEARILHRFRTEPSTASFWRTFPRSLATLSEATGAVFVDRTDSVALGAPSEGFIDWLHGSEVTYALLLQSMLQNERAGPLLEEFVDGDRLREEIRDAPTAIVAYPG